MEEYSRDQIQSILNEIKQKKSILISSDWGIGKTHFIESLMQTHFKKSEIIYVSLFGIETYNQLIEKVLNPQINFQL